MKNNKIQMKGYANLKTFLEAVTCLLYDTLHLINETVTVSAGSSIFFSVNFHSSFKLQIIENKNTMYI